jgi:hypothetical protein
MHVVKLQQCQHAQIQLPAPRQLDDAACTVGFLFAILPSILPLPGSPADCSITKVPRGQWLQLCESLDAMH